MDVALHDFRKMHGAQSASPVMGAAESSAALDCPLLDEGSKIMLYVPEYVRHDAKWQIPGIQFALLN